MTRPATPPRPTLARPPARPNVAPRNVNRSGAAPLPMRPAAGSPPMPPLPPVRPHAQPEDKEQTSVESASYEQGTQGGLAGMDEFDPFAYDDSPFEKAIPSQIGVDKDQFKNDTLWCGLPESAFAAQSPDVPVGSYYDQWIWDVQRRALPESIGLRRPATVELYVSAQPTLAQTMEKYTNRQGKEVESKRIKHLPPTFSSSHHSFLNVPPQTSPPWGDAQRVLLLPYTANEYEGWEDGRKVRQMIPDIGAARKMLNEATVDGSGFVFLGRCGIDLTASKTIKREQAKEEGAPYEPENYSEYWVVVPLRNVKASHIPEDKELDPSSRFLGVWSGESAELAYQSALTAKGAMMPEGWTPDDEHFITNTQHHGLQRRNAQRQGQTSPIVQPLSEKGAESSVDEEPEDGHLSPPMPSM